MEEKRKSGREGGRMEEWKKCKNRKTLQSYSKAPEGRNVCRKRTDPKQ